MLLMKLTLSVALATVLPPANSKTQKLKNWCIVCSDWQRFLFKRIVKRHKHFWLRKNVQTRVGCRFRFYVRRRRRHCFENNITNVIDRQGKF